MSLAGTRYVLIRSHNEQEYFMMRGGIPSKYPQTIDQFQDLSDLIERLLLPDYVPPTPIFAVDSRVRTQGSCFAQNLAERLRFMGVKTEHLEMIEPVNSPLTNLYFFEYMTGARTELAHESHRIIARTAAMNITKAAIPTEQAFIFTLGLGPALFETGSEVPVFDVNQLSNRHEMRHTTVMQNEDYIRRIIRMLRELNPSLAIILTISPVPLKRAFLNNEPAIATDCISKSTLRVAVANVVNERLPSVYYWPSFEVVKWLAPYMGSPYGADDGKARHVNRSLVDLNMDLFVKYFFKRP